MTDYDAIVIGSGNAGLTAATALQRGGAKTLLLERHNIPGGCATTFVRGDFEFEVALHQLSGMGTDENPFLLRHIFNDLGIMDDLEVVIENELYRMVMPGEFDVTLPADWNELHATLIAEYPEEEESIIRFLTLCETITMEYFLNLPKAEKSNDLDMLNSTCPNYVKYGMVPAKDVINEFFENPNLKTVIGAYWCYIGVAPKDIPFAELASMIYAYAAYKPCHIKGGSQAISSALLESFHKAGGDVRLNCGAEKILTAGDRVIGVRTEHGEVFSCKTVISNSSSIQTYHELLDHKQPPQQARDDMKSRRIGPSAFVLYVGLDCPPEEIGATTASSFIVSERDEEKVIEAMREIAAPLNIMMTCYNLEDKDFAPEGKTSLSILCLQYGEPWEKLSPEEYAKTKHDFANLLLDKAETVYPNIRAHIEEVEAGSPLTMMRYLNTPGGAIYGFDQNGQDSARFRERMNAIDGLYLAGSWNNMGGFQPTYMAGASTARAGLKYIQKVSQQDEVLENA